MTDVISSLAQCAGKASTSLQPGQRTTGGSKRTSLSRSHAHPPASLSVTALLHFPFLFSLRLILPVVVLTGFQEVFGVRGRGHMPLNHHDALSVEQEKEEEERQRSSELIFDEGMRYNLRKKNGSEIFLCDLTLGSKSVS